MIAMLGPLGVAVVLTVVACVPGASPRPAPAASQTVEGSGMRLISSAFPHEGAIPERYTCDGLDVSPPLTLEGVPPDTQALALVMDDPDAPGGTWDHWVAYDIPVSTEIAEDVGPLGTLGRNSWGRNDYGGPCPPGGTHRYVFTLYALDAELGLGPGADKSAVQAALSGRVLAEAVLMGRYGR